jgi:hypothetical protein
MSFKLPKPGLTSTRCTTFCTTRGLKPTTTLGKRTFRTDPICPPSSRDRKRMTFLFDTSTSEMPAMPTLERFRFFALPRELRDMVYDLAFDNINILSHLLHEYYSNSRRQRGYFNVIAVYGQRNLGAATELPTWMTCGKQLRQEALKQFYRKAVFTISPKLRMCHPGKASFNLDYDTRLGRTTPTV